MADTHDTIKGLLAEFRGYAAGMPDSYHVTMSWADFRKMLDRFDAAHRREVATTKESLAVGNSGDCAKLREALEFCVKGMCGFCRMDAEARGMTTMCVHGCEALLMAKAALAAPPRNCDVGTIGQQDERFTAFCNRHFKAVGLCDKDCPCRDFNMIGGACSIVWAQLPYEEGCAK